MKYKWLISILIIIILTLFVKINAKEDNTIKINLEENESAVTFILEKNLNALYIQQYNKKELIILDYDNDKKQIEKYLIENHISKFNTLYTITPVLINLFGKTSEYIKTDNNLIKFKINNKNFCIYVEEYQTEPNLKQCNFLYIIEYRKSLLKNLIGNPGVIFQNENKPLPIHIQEKIYDDWTELYTINNMEYIILKISQNGFDTMVVPKNS